MNIRHLLQTALLVVSAMFVSAQQSAGTSAMFEQLMSGPRHASRHFAIKGHSHNDYEQDIPFFNAYCAGMESIEVDVFLLNGTLYAAHEAHEIKEGYTLDSLYLRPLAERFAIHGQRPFADSTKSLQLLIDLKEDYRVLIPPLLGLLEKYRKVIDPALNTSAVHIVISGSLPPPETFKNYPSYLFFDGRPGIPYSTEQLQRVALISDNIRNYTEWNGKGIPMRDEMTKIRRLASDVHAQEKTLRLWGAPEGAHAWIVMEKLGITWLNTDHPERLGAYLDERGAAGASELIPASWSR